MSEFRHTYHPGPMGVESQCGVTILQKAGRRPLVIMRELEDNPGMSVTNAVETIADSLRQKYFSETPEPIWLEHYTHELTGRGPTWDLVDFELLDQGQMAQTGQIITEDTVYRTFAGRYKNPKWQHLSETDAQSLIQSYS